MDIKTQRDQYVNNSKVDLLIDSLARSMPATVLNATVAVAVLWQSVPKTWLLFWFSANCLFVILRYGAMRYDRNHKGRYSTKTRKTAILISFVIAGFLFGLLGLFMFSLPRIEYIVFLYFIAGGMCVGSLGSYHNNLDVHFSYSGIIFVLNTVALLCAVTTISIPMAILGTIFYVTISLLALRLHKDLSESLILRFDNNQLVEKLNEAKQRTEKLNEELMAKNNELKELSLIDPLTGLHNRRYLFEMIPPEIKSINFKIENERRRDGESEPSYGIMILDIDYFKTVNDRFGHDSGDMVLKEFAVRLAEGLRQDDTVCRIGGEEFVIALKNTSREHLENRAEEIRRNIELKPFHISDDRNVNLTCSIGYCYYPLSKNPVSRISFAQIMTLTDKALYCAKEWGRNQAVCALATEGHTGPVTNITAAVENGMIEFVRKSVDISE